MAILEKEVLLGLNSQLITYYTDKNYDIPTYKDKNGISRVKRGTKIWVKVEDLHEHAPVTKSCDFCENKIKTTYFRVLSGRYNSKDGKDRCKKCSDKIKLNSYHDKKVKVDCVANVNPEFSKYFWDQEDSYRFTIQSNKKTDFKCPSCEEKIKNKRIQDVYKYGLSCPNCSDGLSYPEKFMFNLLKQLDIDFEMQQSFKWNKGKKYDFYIPSLNCIIETHGKQHYDGGYYRDLETEKENDSMKKDLAINNGIDNYIEIDSSRSSLEFMKKSIENNHNFVELMDISKVDFSVCNEKANGSTIKIVAELFNKGYRHIEIANELKVSRHTVGRYLKKAKEIGFCDFNDLRGGNEKVIQLTKEGEYVSEYESIEQATRETNINSSSISNTCRGRNKSSGGYLWMYKNDYEKNKNNLKSYEERKSPSKCVIKLDLQNNFLEEYPSLLKASELLCINVGGISNACKGKSKSSAGYKWMYKDDYDRYIENQI